MGPCFRGGDDVVGLSLANRCRLCESRDPYPPAVVLRHGVSRIALLIDHAVWVPARASLGRDDEESAPRIGTRCPLLVLDPHRNQCFA